jgi:hypothetical protein
VVEMVIYKGGIGLRLACRRHLRLLNNGAVILRCSPSSASLEETVQRSACGHPSRRGQRVRAKCGPMINSDAAPQDDACAMRKRLKNSPTSAHRFSPRPLFEGRLRRHLFERMILRNSGTVCRDNAKVCLELSASLRGALATKQSIQSLLWRSGLLRLRSQ